jgi:ATP-dependent Clp protease adaptor protein ClpS
MSTTLSPERTTEKVKLPPSYEVIFHNDDFTPMDFVVALLVGVFHHTEEQANALMMQVHQQGKAVVGTYRRDIAETKQAHVMHVCAQFEHPLQCDVREIPSE